jgi:hypothetical protein
MCAFLGNTFARCDGIDDGRIWPSESSLSKLLWIDDSVGAVEFSLKIVKEIDECLFCRSLATFMLHRRDQ